MEKKIIGYDDVYTIDTNSIVYRNGKPMSPRDNGIGYQQIGLRLNRRRYNVYIHRLDWETFKGDIPNGYEINHIDQNKHNKK